MNLRKIFDEFIRNRSVYCSDETIKSYEIHLGIFFTFLNHDYGKSIDELTFDDLSDDVVNDYIIYLRRVKNCHNVTIRSYFRVLKAFLRYCYINDYCLDYLKGVKLPPDDSKPKIILYADEVEKIDKCFDRNTLKGMRNYSIFHLMVDCGLRSQEVRHLKIEDIDVARNILHIINSKGNKNRITLIPDFVIKSIFAYTEQLHNDSGYVFYNLNNSDVMTSETITNMFARLKVESGINRLHAHLLRHTFATSYLVGGGNLEFLRVFLGHSDYNVTRGYSQLAAECKMLGVNVYHLDPIFFKKGY